MLTSAPRRAASVISSFITNPTVSNMHAITGHRVCLQGESYDVADWRRESKPAMITIHFRYTKSIRQPCYLVKKYQTHARHAN
jgi:hypothetical protein